jgi:DNA invertase Pin-like site-specific DNA recombinase
MVGYARVSTDDQDLAMQLAKLREVGVHPDNTHMDTLSARAKRRPGLDRAWKDCVAGDTLVVWRLDRLARSTLDLLTKVKDLEARGVKLRSLTEAIETDTIVGQLLLAVLGAVAQFERDLIAERTRTGMAVARENGVQFGAPRRVIVSEAADLFRKGWTVAQVAEHFGCSSRQAVYKYFDAKTVQALRDECRSKRRRT